MSVSLLIITTTCGISFYALSNPVLFMQMRFHPYSCFHYKQWHRILTNIFLHADFIHLMFNILALYSIGPAVENAFDQVYGGFGRVMFVGFYFSSAVFANIFNLFKHRSDETWASVGASGAVSAVMFAFIIFYPNTTGFSFFFIPLGKTPAWVVGLIFLGMSTYFAKRGDSRIDHVAHFWGAVYGIVFPIVGNFWIAQRFIHLVLQ